MATKKKDPTADDANEVVPLTDEGERRETALRARQFPSLYSEQGQAVEVAERTIDREETEDGTPIPDVLHVKEFVALKRDLELEGEDVVHARNINAVRQYMVNQGLRPDADVVFAGSTDLGGPPGRQSVSLRYEVRAVPAVVATDFDLRHTVIRQGVTATERAEFDATREERIKRGYDALREGTPEAERPNAAAADVPDVETKTGDAGTTLSDETASDVGGETKE